MIQMMSEYLLGNVETFYLKYTMGRMDKWTFTTLFSAMFDYCFPKDFMKHLHIKWNNLTQGKKHIQKYGCKIKPVNRKFSEMSECAMVLKFWDGLNSELHEIMALLKANPEIDDLNEIIDKVEQAEVSWDKRN